MIISFVQTKGGTGKSTLAVNTTFSKAFHDKFKSIALVELDPQGTLKNWWQERTEENRNSDNVSFHHISSTQKEVIQDGIKNIATHNELLVLDIPGESTSKLHTKFACAISDIIVIPMRTSTNDESAFADNLLPIIKEIIRSYPVKKETFLSYLLLQMHNPIKRKSLIILKIFYRIMWAVSK
jgi:cellulose biosynthesis protein BcsQ